MGYEFFIAIIAGLGGMLGWGVADFFAKKTIDQIGDIASLAWAHILGTTVLIMVALYGFIRYGYRIDIPSELKIWGLLIFFGVLQALVYFFVYKGFSKGKVSLLSPVFASFSGLVAIFSIILFGENINGYMFLPLIMIFGGILLLNVDFSHLSFWKFNLIKIDGFKEVAFATMLAAFWTLSWDKFVSKQNWISYALFMYLFMTIAILLIAKLQKVKLSSVKPGLWKFLLFAGVGEMAAYFAVSSGYSITSNTSVVAVLSGAFSLPTIILATIFLKERVTKIQIIGITIIILGVVFLSLL